MEVERLISRPCLGASGCRCTSIPQQRVREVLSRAFAVHFLHSYHTLVVDL